MVAMAGLERDELRLASGILLIYLYCASKAASKLRKKLLAADTKKNLANLYPLTTQNSMPVTKYRKLWLRCNSNRL